MSKIFGKKEVVKEEVTPVVVEQVEDIKLTRPAFGITKNADKTYSVVKIMFSECGVVGAVEKVVTDQSFLLISSQLKIEIANSGILENNA